MAPLITRFVSLMALVVTYSSDTTPQAPAGLVQLAQLMWVEMQAEVRSADGDWGLIASSSLGTISLAGHAESSVSRRHLATRHRAGGLAVHHPGGDRCARQHWAGHEQRGHHGCCSLRS